MNRLKIKVRNEADEAQAEIIVDGPIGDSVWDDRGTSSHRFNEALSSIPKGRQILLRVNSEGGSVKDGLGIYRAIKDRADDITVRIDGYALSIASVFPLAASKVVSPVGSIWMIHDPWSMTTGNAEEHRKAAEMLEKHGDELVAIYAERTGKDPDEIREAMKAETWFTSSEAVAWGLADEEDDEDEVSPDALAKIDASKYRNFPVAALLRRGSVAAKSASTATKQKGEIRMDKLLAALVEAKLIPSAKLEDAEAAEFARAAIKQHAETLAARDQRIAELEAQVQASHKRAAEQSVAEAVKAGKLKDDPENRKLWVSAMLKDPEGTKAMLDAIEVPKGKVQALEVAGDTDDGKSVVDQYNELRDPVARAQFYREHAAELKAAAFRRN